MQLGSALAQPRSLVAARRILGCAGVIASGVALAGCMVGPDFVPPQPPTVEGYLPTGQSKSAIASPGHETQRLVRGAELPPDWWALFKSPHLDALVARGLELNA